MGYLRQPRGRALVAAFVATSALFAAFPQIDLAFSGLFYDGGFTFDDTALQRLIRDATTVFLSIAILGAAALALVNRALRRNHLGIDGKRVGYLVLVLALGAGLIVNLTLKDNFGRARPRDVAEFGGARTFTPAFTASNECRKNCSFSSGEAAAGFFAIAVVYALGRRRRAAFAIALGFGATVSLARVAAGAHFLSDTVVSFFIMWLLADVLHDAMALTPAKQARVEPRGALAPTPAVARHTARIE